MTPRAGTGYTPAENLADALTDARPDAPVEINLGPLGRRRVRGFVVVHGRGPVKVKVETWRQMRDRIKRERKEAS